MKLNSLTPILYTKDVSAAIDFYTTNFDFVCINCDETGGRASLSNGDVEVMLSKPNARILRVPFISEQLLLMNYGIRLKTNWWFVTLSRTSVMVCVSSQYMITMVISFSLVVIWVLLHHNLRHHLPGTD